MKNAVFLFNALATPDLKDGDCVKNGNLTAMRVADEVKIFLFGNLIFSKNKQNYSFRYFAKKLTKSTIRNINLCLKAINADFNIHLIKGEFVERKF